MMNTAPFWFVIAAVCLAIDLGARASPLRAGYLVAAAIGAGAAGGVALIGQDAGVQIATAALFGFGAVLFAPKWAQRRIRRRTPTAQGYATVVFDADHVPWVETAQGPMAAELVQRGELTDGQRVIIVSVEPPVARVHPVHGSGAPPPPPLSRCGTLR